MQDILKKAKWNQITPLLWERDRWWQQKPHSPFAHARNQKVLASSLPKEAHLEEFLRGFSPWKKGPFTIKSVTIDGEWRSDLKWQRFTHHLPDLTGKTLLDIGCHNGHAMMMASKAGAEFVLGLDPVPRVKAQFEIIKHFYQLQNCEHLMLGAEHVDLFPESFDVILYMGIAYHHRNPLDHLRQIKEALKPGGTLIFETISILGEGDYCLFPRDRYAAMPNVWFVPTKEAARNWLERIKFEDIEMICEVATTTEEQRVTSWSGQKSLADFLDKNDPTKTIEGYPAPQRLLFKARKKA